jgi:capsular polysaccharide biosynthesis protein
MAEIYDFFGALRKRVRLIVASSVTCALLMALVAFLMKPVYRSMATLDPVTSDTNPLTAGLVTSSMSALGGSLAAITGGITEADRDTDEAMTVLKSREFDERFIEENHLLPVLFPKLWDARNGRWKDGVRVPTLSRGYVAFEKIRKIDVDTDNDFITVEVELPDRIRAAEWANKIVDMLNDELRRRAVKAADASLGYLHDELMRANDTATQQAIAQLIEGQLKQKMLATVTPEFELRFVDHALPSDADRPVRPNKQLMIGVGAPFGALLGIAISLVLYRRELVASGKL